MGSPGIPACLTDFTEGHKVCNGDPNGKTEIERLPCGWRERCIALDRHLKVTGEKLEQHLTIEPDGEDFKATAARGASTFCKFCDSLVEEFRVRDETSGPAEPKTPKGKRKNPRQKKRGPYQEIVERRRKRMFDLFNQFLENLTGKIEKERVPKAGTLEVPGQLYIVDRRKSGYLAVYCRTRDGRDIPIVRADLRPQRMSFNLRLGIKVGGAKKYLGKSLNGVKVRSIEHGQFRMEIKEVSPEAMLAIGTSIGRAIKRGGIPLPPVEDRKGPGA